MIFITFGCSYRWKEEVEKIKQIIKWQKLITKYHELRTRQVWNTKFVEVHLVFNPEILLIDAHRIWDYVEYQIPSIDTKCEWKVMVHLDSYDDSHDIEKIKENK